MIKIFSVHNGKPTGMGFILVEDLKKQEALPLHSLRSLIEDQVDISLSILGPAAKNFSSKVHPSWSSVSYRFLLERVPVSLKQEHSLSLATLLTSSSSSSAPSLEITFSPDAVKPQKPASSASSQAKANHEGEDDALGEALNLLTGAVSTKDASSAALKAMKELPFRVYEKEVISCRTGEVTGHEKMLSFDNDYDDPKNHEGVELCSILKTITKMPAFYDKEPKIKLSAFLGHLQKIQTSAKNSEHNRKILHPLLRFLEAEFEETIKVVGKMVESGQITFNFLWYLFPKDAEFSAQINGEPVGSVVTDCKYQYSFFGASFQVSGSFIKSNGVGLTSSSKWFGIEEFEGLLPLKDLPLQPMTAEKKEELSQRGKIYRDISRGAHYLQYKGSLSIHQWIMTQKFKADGRIMVDPVSFNRFNPNYRTFRFNTEEEKGIDHIPDEKLFMTWPTVPGFSFACKKWGEFLVANLSKVQFDDEAFDRLVMEEEKKRLIKCLVQNSSNSFTDIISGKGGGVIFLLHGAPGVGKTLTAEAVSELLHRPLYCVNIGELGVTTTQLEEKLSQILEMASTWNAIILLDEADIFLERRTENDVKRNALVGIFLRLLEYHQGVLFLTTNRVRSFDEAFHSRISIALHYQPLDQAAREKIWRNLLGAAKIQGELEPQELAKYDLNGRQIKNIIRLAQTIALEEKKPVSREDIAKCVEIARQFQEDISC